MMKQKKILTAILTVSVILMNVGGIFSQGTGRCMSPVYNLVHNDPWIYVDGSLDTNGYNTQCLRLNLCWDPMPSTIWDSYMWTNLDPGWYQLEVMKTLATSVKVYVAIMTKNCDTLLLDTCFTMVPQISIIPFEIRLAKGFDTKILMSVDTPRIMELRIRDLDGTPQDPVEYLEEPLENCFQGTPSSVQGRDEKYLVHDSLKVGDWGPLELWHYYNEKGIIIGRKKKCKISY